MLVSYVSIVMISIDVCIVGVQTLSLQLVICSLWVRLCRSYESDHQVLGFLSAMFFFQNEFYLNSFSLLVMEYVL